MTRADVQAAAKEAAQTAKAYMLQYSPLEVLKVGDVNYLERLIQDRVFEAFRKHIED